MSKVIEGAGSQFVVNCKPLEKYTDAMDARNILFKKLQYFDLHSMRGKFRSAENKKHLGPASVLKNACENNARYQNFSL